MCFGIFCRGRKKDTNEYFKEMMWLLFGVPTIFAKIRALPQDGAQIRTATANDQTLSGISAWKTLIEPATEHIAIKLIVIANDDAFWNGNVTGLHAYLDGAVAEYGPWDVTGDDGIDSGVCEACSHDADVRKEVRPYGRIHYPVGSCRRPGCNCPN
ncbi:MAG: hypothetical protein RTU30_13830 [Candidatus Thorarchaeota archaeon]